MVQEVFGIANIAYTIYRISYTPGKFVTSFCFIIMLYLSCVLMKSLIEVLHYYGTLADDSLLTALAISILFLTNVLWYFLLLIKDAGLVNSIWCDPLQSHRWKLYLWHEILDRGHSRTFRGHCLGQYYAILCLSNLTSHLLPLFPYYKIWFLFLEF